MLTLIYKILLLLQLLKYSSQINYWSTYWQTTYASDKVPDYWNHGSIYVTRPPQTMKVDIFSSWLARAITEPSRRVTVTTPIEDYEIYIFKTSTDKIFHINNAEIEKESKAATHTARTPMSQIDESRAKSINPNSIYLRALARKNNDFTHPKYESKLEDIGKHPPFTTENPIEIALTEKTIISENILRTATPRPDTYYFTRPEYDTMVNDYDAHPTTTMQSTVITEESDSIITENTFPTTTPKPEKYRFTRLELETTGYDDDAHPAYITIKPKVKKSSEESESNSITADRVFTKTRTPKINRYTSLELETTVHNDDAHHRYKIVKPKVKKSTEESESNSIIADSMFTTTAPRSEKYRFTRPEYDTTVYNYDDHLPCSTIKPSVTESTEESQSNSIITDKLFTTKAPKPEKYHLTRPEYDTIVYDDDANPTYSTIKPKVTKSTEESKSNSKITDQMFIKKLQGPQKKLFTRLELETTVFDDNVHAQVGIMNPSETKTTIESELSSIMADSVFTTTAPRPEKYHFTHPEYDKTVYDYDSHPTSTTMHTTVIKKESDSIITNKNFRTKAPRPEKYYNTDMFYDTTVYDYDAHHMSTTMRTTVIEKETDSIIRDNIFTTTTATNENFFYLTRPEYDTTLNDNDAHLPSSSIKSSTTESTIKSKPNSIITDTIFTKIPPKRTKKLFTRLEYGKIVYYDMGHAPVSIMNARVMTPKSNTRIYENDIRLMASIKGLSLTASPTTDYDMTPTDHYQTTRKELSTPTTIQISSSKADAPLVRAVNQELVSDSFSVFMRKLLIVLSVKRVEDLPVLIDQFREYLWMLLTDGQLGDLGSYINSFLAKTVIILEQYPYEQTSNLFMKYQKVLNNRYKKLPKDINDIIDYMDDTYNKDEEEAMQAILKEASLFPNSRQNNKIAQGLIDYVFLKPMQRLVGTTRGNVLFKMMTEALKIRDTRKDNLDYPQINNDIRRIFNFGKTRSHLSKSTVRSSYEVTTHNTLYRRKECSEGNSDIDIDKPSENSKIIKSSNEFNEHSDETENSEETKENKFYVFKDNDKFRAINGRQHRPFTSANRLSTRTRKIRKYLSTLNNSRYPLKTKLRRLADNIAIQRNTLPNKLRRTTVNSARFIEATDSSNIEMKLKAKINEKFKRVNVRNYNYNVSRRMRHSFTSTMNVINDSHESDVERVLKSNIYKAMKKLFNTNIEN